LRTRIIYGVLRLIFGLVFVVGLIALSSLVAYVANLHWFIASIIVYVIGRAALYLFCRIKGIPDES
jgi:hypothetical protein